MRWLKPLFFMSMTALLFFLFNKPFESLTPFAFGKFFNPFSGFWQNGDPAFPLRETLKIPALNESVVVLTDDRGVPHIFAQNDYDLYFSQGYLTAKDRLWQMEFLTFVASGRLAEILGDKPGIVEHDRFRRRAGMIYAAENALKKMQLHAPTRKATQAFADGVNAWIDGLSESDFPLEYKILNYKPEIWTPLKSALLLKYMAWDLTGRNDEWQRTLTRAALGDSAMAAIFFQNEFNLETIIPPKTRWAFSPSESPKAPEKLYLPENLPISIFREEKPDAGNGSNNWVVSGSKTASGKPILCNDPHLGLTLPSIWYEIQLVSPDVNVYGVALPGAPAVTIGFNRNIAWGYTNAGTDVMDWYEITFRDENADEYLYNGKWRPVQKRVEAIKIRGGKTLFETIPMTHYGPVVYMPNETPFRKDIPTGAALRWVAHDPSNELRTFIEINRAKNYDEFWEAISYFDCPAQNFIFASANGDIAIHHNGKFPIRWPRQGRYVSNGADPQYEWKGFIPREQIPKVKNPKQGFLESANQKPVAPGYPYVMSGKYATFERGARIHQRLSEMENITPDDMMDLQLDNLNLRAKTVLPATLASLDTLQLSVDEKKIFQLLKSWDYHNRRDEIPPIIFEYFWDNLVKQIWDDDLPGDQSGVYLYPNASVTMNLLVNNLNESCFDNRKTPEKEDRVSTVTISFKTACQQLTERFGQPGDQWRWGTARGTDIPHFGRISGLGKKHLPTDGNYAIVNATKKKHGPSWRMIVQLGETPQAWGVYPGGESGNPGSRGYDQFVDNWLNGKYYKLLYLTSPADVNERLISKSLLQK